MLKKVDIEPSPSGFEDLEYYKSLARLAERRARDIRRIAALEREQLEKRAVEREISGNTYAAERDRLKKACIQLQNDLNGARAELEEFRNVYKNLANSRAHGLADVYVRLAAGDTLLARILRPLRTIVHLLIPRKTHTETDTGDSEYINKSMRDYHHLASYDKVQVRTGLRLSK